MNAYSFHNLRREMGKEMEDEAQEEFLPHEPHNYYLVQFLITRREEFVEEALDSTDNEKILLEIVNLLLDKGVLTVYYYCFEKVWTFADNNTLVSLVENTSGEDAREAMVEILIESNPVKGFDVAKRLNFPGLTVEEIEYLRKIKLGYCFGNM